MLVFITDGINICLKSTNENIIDKEFMFMLIIVKTGNHVLIRGITKLETINKTSLSAKVNNVKNKRLGTLIIRVLLMSELLWSNLFQCFKIGIIIIKMIFISTTKIVKKNKNTLMYIFILVGIPKIQRFGFPNQNAVV